ncbi:MAG: (d)CMP kinase [Candidatus Limnocylindria bacterium]
MSGERLQTVLARAGLGSRRAADGWIADGRVTVNGSPAMPGTRVDPTTDRVTLDGRVVELRAPSALHLAIHKPRGVLSSASAARGRPAVVDLVRPRPPGRLWPAGRLDVESEGLLLLTNDGAWTHRVLHPRYGTQREYAVELDTMPAQADLDLLVSGVELDEGPARLLHVKAGRRPPEAERGPESDGVWLTVRLGEGRKREVRRLFAAAGYPVRRLVRVAIGPITLDGLRPGAWRRLTAGEVAALGGKTRPAPRRRRAAPLRVAVDGTSGSGKSTIGRALAERIGARFVDTGLLYRSVALAALEAGIDPDDEAALARLARTARIKVHRPEPAAPDEAERVTLNGRDVTGHLREPRIERAVPTVSRHAAVRQAMLKVQRDAARGQDTVMVGRDIGTVVLPDAELKVFLTASVETRARRRAAQMGRPDRVAAYRREIENRDRTDSTRPVAPLRRAPDAMVLDTGELDVDACVDGIVAALPSRAGR